jgi:hypothetical protein
MDGRVTAIFNGQIVQANFNAGSRCQRCNLRPHAAAQPTMAHTPAQMTIATANLLPALNVRTDAIFTLKCYKIT